MLPTPERVEEGLFLQSRQEILAGIGDSEHPEDRVALESLLFGWGYSRERNRVSREGASTRAWKMRALDNNWRTLHGRFLKGDRSGCRFQHEVLSRALEERQVPDAEIVKDLSVQRIDDRIEVACGAQPEDYVRPDEAFLSSLPGASPFGAPDPAEIVEAPEASASAERRRRLLQGLFGNDPAPAAPSPRETRRAVRAGPQLAEAEHILVDDRLHLGTLEALAEALDRRTIAWDLQDEKPDLYDPEILYWHQDFRVLLAMRYINRMAEQYGVQTEIREVLSMPLGASEITLEEATSMYSGLVSGQAWEFPGLSRGDDVEKIPTSTLLIQEIRDVDGHVLYRAVPTPTRVAERPVAEMTVDILRNVVLHGTGRRAKTSLSLGGHPLPVGGKTGTTNDFKNAAFLGYAPIAGNGGFDVQGGFVIGAYVGYDDNRSMSRGKIRLAGASGALPAWMGTIQGLSDTGLLGRAPSPPPADGEPWALLVGSGMARTFVEPKTGLSTEGQESEAMTLVTQSLVEQSPEVEFEPIRRPHRVAPGTEDAMEEPARRRAPRAGN